jgi:hypothetical protein
LVEIADTDSAVSTEMAFAAAMTASARCRPASPTT